MPAFVLLTRVQAGAPGSGADLRHLEERVMDHIRRECPDVTWRGSWALLGPFDYLDIFEAPDAETAARVSTLVRLHGDATTETWGAVPWDRYKTLLHRMPPDLVAARP